MNGVVASLNLWLNRLAARQDVALAGLFVCAVLMMIIPLPTGLVDVLIAANLSLSLLLLMLAIYTQSPAQFSAFPSVLLLTTLYRLSLSISTARLILLQHDAGEIVSAFGHFVVRGNLTVGIIIFSIITIIQFLVITKGAERVAEVSARFSLDAMPGKQMSIDGDMRAGVIDAATAKILRDRVQQESQLYGAMDGAMKFVKGDAIASIIVVVVNILGGILVGILQQGMSATEAINTYAILSIGDGLISQIPALLISITAGIIVTRVPNDDSNLAEDIFSQMGRRAQPLSITALFLIVFACIPGFPKLAFGVLAMTLGGLGYLLQGREATAEATISKKEKAAAPLEAGAAPLALSMDESWNQRALQRAYQALNDKLFESLGIALPELRFFTDTCPPDRQKEVHILIYQTEVGRCAFPENKELLYLSNEAPEGDAVKKETDSLLPPNAVWTDLSEKNQLEERGLQCFDSEAAVMFCLERAIRLHAKEFIGIQETRFLMDAMEARYGELVKELQRQVPLARVMDVLQRLLEEGVPIRNLRAIFETLILWNNKEKDIVVLTEYVRVALQRDILAIYKPNDQTPMKVIAVGEALENLIRSSIRQTAAGAYAALDSDQTEQVIRLVKENVTSTQTHLLLTSIDIRRYLRKLIERALFDVAVLSQQEVGDQIALNIVCNLEWIEASDA